jgi:murein DD-endopeptidase MepM/ murein hydrolase activator NlpD
MSEKVNLVKELISKGKYITSRFGHRPGGVSGNAVYKAGDHRGVDIGGYRCGETFFFPLSGKVVAVRTSGMGTWGNTVVIAIDPDYKYHVLSAHHQKILVKEGQRVERWDPVATVGGTTHVGKTYACHLHLELQKADGSAPWRGSLLDPEAIWLDLSPAKPSTKFETGVRIQSKLQNAHVRIRRNPGTTGTVVVGSVAPDQVMTVRAHPDNGKRVGNYHWWNIGSGWVAEDFFEVAAPLVLYRVIVEGNYTRDQAEMVRQEILRLGYASHIEVIK